MLLARSFVVPLGIFLMAAATGLGNSSSRYYSLVKEGYLMGNAVLAEDMVQIEAECFLKCNNHALCKAVNIFNQILIPAVEQSGLIAIGRFRMKHYGGKYVTYSASLNCFILKKDSSDLFSFTSNMNLLHVSTGKCVVPVGTSNNHRFTLTRDCSDLTLFKQLPDSAIQNVKSGKCMHPLNGYKYPPENQPIVIYKGCSAQKVYFYFEQQRAIKCQLLSKNKTENQGSFIAAPHWNYYEQF